MFVWFYESMFFLLKFVFFRVLSFIENIGIY